MIVIYKSVPLHTLCILVIKLCYSFLFFVYRAVTKTIPNTLKMHLESVVRACFVQGTRTTAHKCSRLLAMCME